MKSFYVEVTADMDEPGDQVGCSSGLQLLQEPQPHLSERQWKCIGAFRFTIRTRHLCFLWLHSYSRQPSEGTMSHPEWARRCEYFKTISSSS